MSSEIKNPFVQFDIADLIVMSRTLKSLMAWKVYCCLVDDCKDKRLRGGVVTYVSALELARELKCSTQTIYNALKELKKAGYILHIKGQHKYMFAEKPFIKGF